MTEEDSGMYYSPKTLHQVVCLSINKGERRSPITGGDLFRTIDVLALNVQAKGRVSIESIRDTSTILRLLRSGQITSVHAVSNLPSP